MNYDMQMTELNTTDKHWTLLKEHAPYEGYTGIVLVNGFGDMKLPEDEFWTDIATFCDGTWYKLDYDDHLGVLRKVPVNGNVYAYAMYLIPSWQDEFKTE